MDKHNVVVAVLSVVGVSFAIVFFSSMQWDLFYVAASQPHKGAEKPQDAQLTPMLKDPPVLNDPPALKELPELPPAGPDCKYMSSHPQSSRPGVPCLPPAPGGHWPWRGKNQWRIDLGERLLRAVTPRVTEGMCDGYDLFGDQTWCNKAFKGGGSDIIGLSYGIEGRDMWSETMSNQFHIPTMLFDCYQPPAESPPLGGTVPNGTVPCRSARGSGDPCYATPYQPFRICLGPTDMERHTRKYATLGTHLKGRAPLSVYLKIDVEGCEWSALEQLLDSGDHAKIRTLDMEIHLGWGAEAELSSSVSQLSGQERLEREVRIMERLQEQFLCTGSTLEVYREGWRPEDCKPPDFCNEPAVYLSGGFSLPMFAVSFVNRKLVT